MTAELQKQAQQIDKKSKRLIRNDLFELISKKYKVISKNETTIEIEFKSRKCETYIISLFISLNSAERIGQLELFSKHNFAKKNKFNDFVHPKSCLDTIQIIEYWILCIKNTTEFSKAKRDWSISNDSRTQNSK